MTGNNITFKTKRDWTTFCEVLKRSDLGLKDPGIVTMEPVVNADESIECDYQGKDDNYEWQNCDRLADVRLVRNRSSEYDPETGRRTGPSNIYSGAYCLRCFQREISAWIDEQLKQVVDDVVDARGGSTEDRRQRARGDD